MDRRLFAAGTAAFGFLLLLFVFAQPRAVWQNDAGIMRGKRHLEPLGDTVALDQENLFFERLQRTFRYPLEHGFSQPFVPVAVQN